ncbi:MAG TPA: ferritin-like domain-containing protein [Dehalococcoidia bacterium]|nr:ferritin-like domain-containing protein [Dehalococcoidia bacterium]
MKVSRPDEIIPLLQDDIRGEHAAIMQYLQHAYRLPEGELPGEVEEIAREEMRHFRWLCEMVVDLGGVPTINRDPIFLDAPTDIDLLRLDIDAEERAIAQYRDHIAAIDNARVVRLLERILADELAHRRGFGEFVEELGGDPRGTQAAGVGPWGGGPADSELALDAPAEQTEPAESAGPDDQSDVAPVGAGPASEPSARQGPFGGSNRPAEDVTAGRTDPVEPIAPNVRLIQALNSDIRKEYAAILRQLHLAFVTKNSDPRLSRELMEDHAQWHMKHMGWLGEQVVKLGGTAETEHEPVSIDGSPRERLAQELTHQGEWVARVDAQRQDTDDEETRFILDRVHTHDAYAAGGLVDLAAATGDDAAEPQSRRPGPQGQLTVGSLLGQRQP